MVSGVSIPMYRTFTVSPFRLTLIVSLSTTSTTSAVSNARVGSTVAVDADGALVAVGAGWLVGAAVGAELGAGEGLSGGGLETSTGGGAAAVVSRSVGVRSAPRTPSAPKDRAADHYQGSHRHHDEDDQAVSTHGQGSIIELLKRRFTA